MFKELFKKKSKQFIEKKGGEILAQQFPTFMSNIMANKSLLIPEMLLVKGIETQLNIIDDIETGLVKCTEQGIEIEIIYKKHFFKTNLKTIIKIDKVQLNNQQKIFFSISDLSLSARGLMDKIIVAIASLFIEKLVDNKLSSISTDEITLSKENGLYVCDISEISQLKNANKCIPLINKPILDLIKIKHVIHQENGILFKCSVTY